MRNVTIYRENVDVIVLFLDKEGDLMYKAYSVCIDGQEDGEPGLDLRFDEDGGVLPVDMRTEPLDYGSWIDWAVAAYAEYTGEEMEGYTVLNTYWR